MEKEKRSLSSKDFMILFCIISVLQHSNFFNKNSLLDFIINNYDKYAYLFIDSNKEKISIIFNKVIDELISDEIICHSHQNDPSLYIFNDISFKHMNESDKNFYQDVRKFIDEYNLYLKEKNPIKEHKKVYELTMSSLMKKKEK